MPVLRQIIYLLITACTAALPAAAQISAGFSASPLRGCAPLTVTVTDLSGAPAGTPINYDWGDGSGLDSDTVHTYIQPGLYSIVQTVANANPRTDTVEVLVEAPPPVRFSALNCGGGGASIRIEDTGYNAYEVDWGDGTVETLSSGIFYQHNYGTLGDFVIQVKGLFDAGGDGGDAANINCNVSARSITLNAGLVPAVLQVVLVTAADQVDGIIELSYQLDAGTGYYLEMILNGVVTILDTLDYDVNPDRYEVAGLNTSGEYYCFRITAFDPCNNDRVRSPIGCSIQLETLAGNNRNDIEWFTATAPGNFLRSELYRDSVLIFTGATQGDNTFTDTDVVCGMQYCYRLIMYETGGLRSISAESCLEAISQDIPPGISDISASVSGSEVEIAWPAVAAVPVTEFSIYRSPGTGQFVLIGTTVDLEFTDSGLSTGGTVYQYSVRYLDVCGNTSENSITASTILLRINPDKSLQWSPYLGWSNGVSEYLLEKYDADGQLLETISIGSGLEYTDDPADAASQIQRYRILASANDGGLPLVASNFVEVVFPSRVFFPNAFTPNGDGLNDYFTFSGNFIRSFSIRIFTRWGELIYESSDPARGWDGTVHGRNAPTGTYVFRAEMTDEMGIRFTQTGEVVLIR